MTPTEISAKAREACPRRHIETPIGCELCDKLAAFGQSIADEYEKTEDRFRDYDKSGPVDEATKEALNAIDDYTDGSRHPWRTFAHVLARALRASWAKIADFKESANAHRDAQIRAEDLVRKLAASLSYIHDHSGNCEMWSEKGNCKISEALALVPAELRSDK